MEEPGVSIARRAGPSCYTRFPVQGALRLAFLAVVVGSAAAAQTRTLAVSAGACRDTDLVQAQAAFAEVLKQRLGSHSVDTRALLAELKPASALGIDELEHLVETAKSQ